jgi:hypothetical protein
MTKIYVDGSVAILPDAPSRLVHLTDAGHAVVLVATAQHPAASLDGWPERVEAMPGDPLRGSWFLTADPTTCHDRQAGLSTLLIGPRDDSPRPTRCDLTARNLSAAVLEILARDVMN